MVGCTVAAVASDHWLDWAMVAVAWGEGSCHGHLSVLRPGTTRPGCPSWEGKGRLDRFGPDNLFSSLCCRGTAVIRCDSVIISGAQLFVLLNRLPDDSVWKVLYFSRRGAGYLEIFLTCASVALRGATGWMTPSTPRFPTPSPASSHDPLKQNFNSSESLDPLPLINGLSSRSFLGVHSFPIPASAWQLSIHRNVCRTLSSVKILFRWTGEWFLDISLRDFPKREIHPL